MLPTTSSPTAPSNGDDEDTCPVCYEAAPPACVVPCKVCKHAVCGTCDTMLTQTGHDRCPMCRAPRPRRSTQALLSLVHAFHCPGATCKRPRCNKAKLLLLRIAVHAHNYCASRELRGGPGDCELCTLWRELQRSTRTRTPCSPHAPAAGPTAVPPQDGLLQEATLAAADNVRPDPAALRARLLELPSAQLKRMLLTHMRWCRNRRCQTCSKVRERIQLK